MDGREPAGPVRLRKFRKPISFRPRNDAGAFDMTGTERKRSLLLPGRGGRRLLRMRGTEAATGMAIVGKDGGEHGTGRKDEG